jgi:hypothetical protein
MNLALFNEASSTDLAVRRNNIVDLERMALEMPQVEIPVKHYIHGGMYIREITIPKGTLLTGDIYVFDHFDIMIRGDILVTSVNGEAKRMKGHNVFEGLRGKKRAAYTHEETVWMTIHPFGGEDGDEIQSFVTAKSFEDLDAIHLEANKQDFYCLLNEIGMTEEEIQAEMDATPVYDTVADISIQPSKISGVGVFATRAFEKGEAVAIARTQGKKTTVGRYTNHGITSNVVPLIDGEELIFIADRRIDANEEVLANYRDILGAN